MINQPRFSIVTPSFNQSRYIAETIESVMAQNYDNFEHIVVDGGSTDGTLDIISKYPHLRTICEPDRNQADAINKGFRLARGDVWAFLNSDDTLLPGAFDCVSKAIDPGRGRHIVMGRCRFIDEHSNYIGVDHPSYFESHRRVLQIWKGHMIPQPSVFWTPEVWKTCGPLDENLNYPWIDYDLFCRFSEKYAFHFVDQVLSNYRLHHDSKTVQESELDRLEDSIRISKRYWGRSWSFMYWQLAASLASYRINRVGRGRDHFRKAKEAKRQGNILQVLSSGVIGAMLAPEIAFYVIAYPWLLNVSKGFLKKILVRHAQKRGIYPETAAYLSRTEPFADGWIGPRLVISVETTKASKTITLQGRAELRYLATPLDLRLKIGEAKLGNKQVEKSGEFVLNFTLPASLPPGEHAVEVQTDNWYVPHRLLRNGDFRPLAWKLIDMKVH